MADRKPLKVLPDGGGDSTGLGEFVADDTIAVADGGTGATTASGARTNLGASPTAGSSSITTLGTIATGTWEATDVAVAHGGTGASTASAARTNLGITDTNPGGSNTELQYNNSGAFGASANLTFADGTLKSTGNAALASQDAKKIILVDLTDPGTMWDVEAFLSRAKWTSWYKGSGGVGAPPMRGAIWINNAQTTVIWWNLDTDALYLSFTGAANANVLKGTAISDLAFLDGILYASSAHGSTRIDFLRDGSDNFGTSGHMTNFKDIENRNVTQAWSVLRATPALSSDTVNAVAAVRDPLVVDEFDRPKHWWVAAQSNATSIYNPINDAIYSQNLGSDPNKSVSISPTGMLWQDYDHGTDGDTLGAGLSIYGISATWDNAIGVRFKYVGPGWTDPGGTGIVKAFDSQFATRLGAVIIACNQGIGFLHWYGRTAANFAPEALCYFSTSTYATPLMKGTRVAAYPLNDANDRSGQGHNLTNNNTVTFASGGPTGSYANFVAASNQTLTLADDADFGGMSELTLSCWFNRDIDSGAAMILMGKYDTASSGDRSFLLQIDSADKINFQCITSAGSVGASPGNPATAINTWYHVAAIYDGANLKVYLNGVLIGSASQTGTVVDTTEPFCIGSHTSGSPNANWFDGQIAGVFVGSTAMTEAEVNLEYQRGVRVLGGATATLANSDVKSVRIDQNSGLAAIPTAANQTEIWDITTGLRESIDATTTATIADADLSLKSGADDPEYITGRSGAIEFDGKARRVIG